MQTPIPEPYDITEIPYIAWVPDAKAWGIAAALLAVLVVYVWRRNNPSAPRGDIKIIDKMLTELRQTIAPERPVNLERASRIARRVISFISGKNVAELTAEELRSAISEDTPHQLSAIMRAVASFEEIGYAPPSPGRDESARSLGQELASLINDYRNSLRAR